MEPTVEIGQGVLQGKVMTSRKGRSINAFQGIPYAEPPVGDLRFQGPRGAPNWSGVRLAQKEGNDCMQKHFFKGQFVGSEDCLYLNVYTPAFISAPGTEKCKKLPVMVWIHGGGFFAGSGGTEMYGPEFLLDHDVVLVTFNYRLGTLGFLNLGNEDVPGNFGLKDQVEALRWVQRNIHSFGGDPGLVTIFGESAGGSSVHYLLISPLAKGLFHRAIVQSGSALNPWAFREAEEAKALSVELCNQLDCTGADGSVDLVKLRGVSAQRCAEEGKRLKESRKLKAELVPTLEIQGVKDAFLTEHPRLCPVADVPIMIGLTSHEGLLEVSDGVDLEKHYNENKSDFVPWSELKIEKDSEAFSEKWKQIDEFYQKISNGDFTEKYIHINSDIDFVCGVDDLVRATASSPTRTQPLFYYQFSYDGGLGFFKKKANISRAGACHTDELSYLFTREMPPSWQEAATDADLKTIDRMTLLWTNFAKFGNPTPQSSEVTWEPVKTEVKQPENVVTQHLDIGENLEMRQTSLNEERIMFWRNLLKK